MTFLVGCSSNGSDSGTGSSVNPDAGTLSDSSSSSFGDASDGSMGGQGGSGATPEAGAETASAYDASSDGADGPDAEGDDSGDAATFEPCGCSPGVQIPCFTTCSSVGAITCSGDCMIPNACVPPAELCNGLDDDCDDTPDNGFACTQFATMPCSTSCDSVGSQVCTAACTLPAACEAPAETCNALDDDCDDATDNGLDLSGTPYTLTGDDPRRGQIAYSGSNYAVAYVDIVEGPIHTVQLQRFSATGAALGDPIEVDNLTGGLPSIAWNGTVFGIVWPDIYTGGGVNFRAFSETGVPSTDIISVADTNSGGTSITTVGSSDFLIAFNDYVPPDGSSFYSARLTAAGALVGIVNDIGTPGEARITSPELLDALSGKMIFWADNRSGSNAIFARALADTGIPSAAEVSVVAGELWDATTAGSGFLLSYQDSGAQLQRTDSTGTASGDPVTVGASQLYAAIRPLNSRFGIMLGTEFQLRANDLSLISTFPFLTPAGSGNSLGVLNSDGGRFFALGHVPLQLPVTQVFGDLGCN
ncbi:MAG: hypothetical protein HRU17_08695 [Polyangiaceae bacterium]|nr:hypothetical protein [Polyangiaceae bacterium]